MTSSDQGEKNVSFWDHLDVFRNVLLRCLVVWVVCSGLCFVCKDQLFGILFAPSHSNFILYRALCWFSQYFNIPALCPNDFDVHFISIELTAQFATHVQVSLWMGFILLSPYLVYALYGFVSPALYDNEKKYSRKAIIFGFGLFILGVLLNYFLIFPFSFRFLYTYQVQPDVINHISLSSYIHTLLILSLLLGLLFEMPILGWLLAQMGIVDEQMLKQYRRHAFVVVLIVAAIITPTADALTLLVVTIPIYVLYEITILIVRQINHIKK